MVSTCHSQWIACSGREPVRWFAQEAKQLLLRRSLSHDFFCTKASFEAVVLWNCSLGFEAYTEDSVLRCHYYLDTTLNFSVLIPLKEYCFMTSLKRHYFFILCDESSHSALLLPACRPVYLLESRLSLSQVFGVGMWVEVEGHQLMDQHSWSVPLKGITAGQIENLTLSAGPAAAFTSFVLSVTCCI